MQFPEGGGDMANPQLKSDFSPNIWTMHQGHGGFQGNRFYIARMFRSDRLPQGQRMESISVDDSQGLADFPPTCSPFSREPEEKGCLNLRAVVKDSRCRQGFLPL